jgi:hypothetical protein
MAGHSWMEARFGVLVGPHCTLFSEPVQGIMLALSNLTVSWEGACRSPWS